MLRSSPKTMLPSVGAENGPTSGPRSSNTFKKNDGKVSCSVEADRAQPDLSMPTYQFWYDILADDNVGEYQRVMDENTAGEQLRLLNGRFRYACDDLCRVFGDSVDVTLTLPVAVACSNCSMQVVDLMIKGELNILATESNGNNVIHTMVQLCVHDRNNIRTVIRAYRKLCELLPVSLMLELLMMEDAEGLRPLETAAKEGAMEMVRVIFETKGVYLIIDEKRGVMSYKSYDITDYEDPGSCRLHKSPLALASTMEEEWASRQQAEKLMSWQPIRQWCRGKCYTNLPILIVWFLLRVLHFFCFLLYDTGVSIRKMDSKVKRLNLTSTDWCPGFGLYEPTEPYDSLLKVYVVSYAAFILIFDIAEGAKVIATGRPFAMRVLVKRKEPVVHFIYYRVCQAILAVCIIILFGISTFRTEYGYYVVDYIRLFSVLLASWSLLFFFQLMPSIGYFVVIIQRMLSDLLHFFVIYVIFLVPFAHLFQMFMNENTNQGCIDYFRDVGVGLYSTFTIMLNMIDLRSFNIVGEKAAALYILHFTYVYVIAILLVNFLIAILSNAVTKVAENSSTIMIVERLSVAYLIEFRCRLLLKWYYKIVRRWFYHFENDRIYLLSKEVQGKETDILQSLEK